MKNKLYKLLLILMVLPFLGKGQATIQNLPFSPNGTVHCQKQVGSTLYVGGDFTSIDVNTGSLAGININNTPTALPLPFVNGTVNTVVSDGTGGYLIGGSFSSVGGQYRQNFARINPDMTVNPMNIGFNSVVNKIVVFNGTAYVVGGFSSAVVNNSTYFTRNRAAAILLANNSLSNWSASISSGYVYDAVLNGSNLYIGGYFRINSEDRVLAGYNLAAGGVLLSNFKPVISTNGSLTSAYVYSLTVANNRLYFGGSFNRINNITCSNISSINLTTNTTALINASPNSAVYALTWYNNILYVGGAFTAVNNVSRPRLFAYNTIVNSVFNSWTPAPNQYVWKLGVINNNLWVSGYFSTISSTNRNYFAAYTLNPSNINVPPILNTNIIPNPNNIVQTILPINNATWIAGGSFTKLSAGVRNGALAVNLLNNTLTNFAPNVTGSVRAIEVVGTNVFLGGSFSKVNETFVNNFAVVNSNTGQSNNIFRANFNGPINSIVANGSQVYVGGQFSLFSTIGGPASGSIYRNGIAALILTPTYLQNNAAFNANLGGWTSSPVVKVLKMFNGQLFAGGSFAFPRNAIASLNPNTGSVNPFNANVNYSYARVNDLSLTTSGQLALGGYIPYINNTYTYNLAYVDPSSGFLFRSNYNSPTFVSGMNSEVTALVPGNLNDIMYVTNSGLYRTQNNTGATALAFSQGGNKLCISKIGTRYIIGGNFSYYNSIAGAYYYNLMAVDFIPPMPPTIPASQLTFSNVTTNSMQVSWNNGNGNARILMARAISMGTGHPSDFTTYYASSSYGSGSNIGGAFVMSNGTNNSAWIYNLQPGTKYDFKVVEYNGTGINSVYASNFALGSQTTQSILPPTMGPGSVFANNISKNAMTLNFNGGNGNGRIVVARAGAPVNVSPSNDILYSPSSTFGYGSHLGSGNYIIARGNINNVFMSGLTPGTNYYFSVYEYNNYGSYIWRHNYNTVASNMATTVANAPEPTVASNNLTVENNGGGSVKVRWTKGNGSHRILLAANGAYNGVYGVYTNDGVTYTANSNFNSNSPYPSFISVNNFGNWFSNRVVYNGTGDSTIIYGLNSNSTYNFILVEYNTLGIGSENYMQNAWSTVSFTTPALVTPPTIPANNVKVYASSNNQMRLSWNNGNGSQRIVVAKKGSPTNFAPVMNNTYAANSNFGIGTNYSNGNYIVYNGTESSVLINNLEAYSDYYFSVYEYNAAYNYYTYQNEVRYLNVAGMGNGKSKPANWPRVAGGRGTDAAGGVATDANGNVYTVGAIKGSTAEVDIYFGVTPIFGATNTQAFITKHNSAGVLQWVKHFGGNGEDAASTVTVDNDGNAYVVGSFRGTVYFNDTLITSNGSEDAFIAKYNTNGTLQWVRTMGGSGQDVAFWAKTDANGNVVVTGYFHGTPSFSNSTQTLVSAGNSDIWIAKYSGSNGNLIWAVGAGGNSYDYGHSVTIGANNSVIVAGEFKTTANFGSNQLSTNTNESRGFVAKLNNAGAWQWVKAIGNKSKAMGITADANDNYYVVGGFTDSAYFDGQPFMSRGLYDAFISRVNTNGTIQWTNQIGGISEDGASGVSIASDGLIHMVGTFADACIVNTATTLTTAGGHDIFTAAFTNTGLLAQARRFGGPLEDKARAIHAANAANVYICGYFTGSADFGGFVMNATPSVSASLPEWDLFVHNIGSTYTPPSSNNDLIAWYRFNNNLNDFSGNNFNATSNLSPVFINDRLNTANSAMSFNGSSTRATANINNKPEYNNLNEFTYTAWVRASSFNNITGYSFLLHKTNTSYYTTGYIYAYLINNGMVVMEILDAGLNYTGHVYSNPSTISLNTWVHVAFTYKSGNYTKLFINGTEVTSTYSSGANNGLVSFNDRELSMGGFKDYTDGYAHFFNGTLDDVRIYKRALTQQEINDIRNSTSANSAPPMENKNKALVGNEPSILYPNPNTGSFNLDFTNDTEKSLSFRIVDLSGKIVLEENTSIYKAGLHTKKFELSGYTKGYYTLQVLENNRILENHKVIINE